MWLAYATGVLEEAGFDVRLIDAPAQGRGMEDLIPLIKDFAPELAVIDTSTPSIYNDVKVAAKSRKARRRG